MIRFVGFDALFLVLIGTTCTTVTVELPKDLFSDFRFSIRSSLRTKQNKTKNKNATHERRAQRYCSLSLLSRTVGQVEPDKWPLEELVRLRGRATSAHRVRRGRVSFDGFRQIAKSQITENREA